MHSRIFNNNIGSKCPFGPESDILNELPFHCFFLEALDRLEIYFCSRVMKYINRPYESSKFHHSGPSPMLNIDRPFLLPSTVSGSSNRFPFIQIYVYFFVFIIRLPAILICHETKYFFSTEHPHSPTSFIQ